MRRVLALSTAGLAICACQALVTLTVEAPQPDAAADAANDVADADAGATDPCTTTFPARPTKKSAATTVPPILFAAYKWAIERIDDPDLCPAPAAFNLDGLDTEPRGACNVNASCQARQESSGLVDGCDTTGGGDNNALRALAYLRTLPFAGGGSFEELDTTIALRRGVSNMLLELVDYDGESDDDDITLNFYASAGMRGVPNAAGLGFEQVKSMPEVWDGGQDAAWIAATESLTDDAGVRGPRFVGKGWVRDHVLVIPHVPIDFGPPSLFAIGEDALNSGVLSAEIVREGSHTKLVRGRIGAGVRSSALLAALASIRYQGGFMCASSTYPLARTVACSALDLPPLGVGADAAVPCGSMSMTFSFASIESALARDDAGAIEFGTGYASTDIRPCADDAGHDWCDDCDWPGPRHCEAGTR